MKRRLAEAKTDEEREAIEEEYDRKDEEQQRQEKEEEKILRRMGIPSNKIADYFNDYFNDNRYLGYRTLDGSLWLRTGDIEVTPPLLTLVLKNSADYASGVALSIDENMSFGLMRELYKSIRGHYPYTSKTNIHYLGRAVGDIVSMGVGSLEIASGFGAIGGGIEAGASGAGAVATPALTAAGAAAVVHGGTSVVRASQNFADDISKFNASTSRSETTLNDIQSKLSGLGTKNERYIKKRGWSIDSIKDVIQHPHTTRKAFNKSTGSEATVYYNKQGDYVVIDNNTKELIQTSKYGDKNWIPDSTIQDPYKPHN